MSLQMTNFFNIEKKNTSVPNLLKLELQLVADNMKSRLNVNLTKEK